MDSMSGSLKDSDPTSPVSPGSPDPNSVKHKITTPGTLLQALSTLNSKDQSICGNVPSCFFLNLNISSNAWIVFVI